jgi:hypothetical protein
VTPPLATASLSLAAGRAILAAGDVAAPLRSRIADARAEAAALLAGAGIGPLLPCASALPYLLLAAGGDGPARLEAAGVRGKRHPVWPPPATAIGRIYRLSAPLAAHRMGVFRERIRA